MSRAFVREADGNDVPEQLPERPVSTHPNFVTARGWQQIETRVRDLERGRETARLADDKPARARLDRDLRYWQQRRATARLVEPVSPPDRVRFGVAATIAWDDGSERRFVLVGEDEADPAADLISWVSPIAQALLGHEAGDEVELQGRRAEILKLDVPIT